MKTLFVSLLAITMVFTISWTVIAEIDRAKFVARVGDAQAKVDAIAAAQDFAMPLVELSEQLARENAMFTQVIDRARDIVTAKEIELAQVKESLHSSIELLQEQIVENNECIDEIRDLESQIRKLCGTVDRLMKKIPNSEDIQYPYDPNYNH